MTGGEMFEFGGLSVDLGTRQAWLHGEELALTSTEFLLLKTFVTNPGKIFTRDELLDKVWGNEFDGSPRAIDAHIKNLRKKLSAVVLSNEFIQSIRGMGYKFVPPAARAAIHSTEKKPESPPPTNLPTALTSFVGRVRERQEIGEALDSARLLTLTGPGGSGKTRLAVEAARERVSKYAGGTWLVELAALTDPNLVPSTVATALKLREEPARTLAETLIDHLRGKNVLLVVDNCEHLIDACANLIETLLEGCPDLRVLATSRESLKVPGERTYNVPPMSAPSGTPQLSELMELDSVNLLIDRVRSISPSFTATKENAPFLAEICSQLDGIPLAIELAAGRARMMPVEQIASRLTHRLALLSGGSRTALPRHQTLQATIRWSYELLTDEEAALFARLAVFRGGFTLEAAEQICPGGEVKEEQVLDLLARLVEKSLVTVSEGPGEAARYDMLVTIREFAEDKLECIEGSHAVRERHASYFVTLAEAVESYLSGPNHREWLWQLEAELENLRSTFQWCFGSRPARSNCALRLGGALRILWESRGHCSEGRKLLERAIAMSENEDDLLAKAMFCAGEMAWDQADFHAAESLIKRALLIYERFDDKKGIARVHMILGNIAAEKGDFPESDAHYGKTLAIYREMSDKKLIASVLLNLGANAQDAGDFARAWTIYEEGLELAESSGNVHARARILTNVSDLALSEKEFEKAKSYAERALAIHRELGDKKWEAITLRNLGSALNELGDTAKGRGLLSEALNVSRAIGVRYDTVSALLELAYAALKESDVSVAGKFTAECIALCREIQAMAMLSRALVLMGDIACAQSLFERGARFFGAADALRRRTDSMQHPIDAERSRSYIALAKASLTEESYECFFKTGSELLLDEVVGEALKPGFAQ